MYFFFVTSILWFVFLFCFVFAILLKSFKVPKQRGKEEEIQDRSKGSKNLETW
jgi:phosphotransferase system  glucose/maltose/N-acetylglucosamine-specific IIC component